MFMNRAAEEIIILQLGRDPIKMIGESVWTLFAELADTPVGRELRRALEEDHPFHYEFCYPTAQRWYEVGGLSVAPGIILIFRDITECKLVGNNLQGNQFGTLTFNGAAHLINWWSSSFSL
jgi:hypothetical protein